MLAIVSAAGNQSSSSFLRGSLGPDGEVTGISRDHAFVAGLETTATVGCSPLRAYGDNAANSGGDLEILGDDFTSAIALRNIFITFPGIGFTCGEIHALQPFWGTFHVP